MKHQYRITSNTLHFRVEMLVPRWAFFGPRVWRSVGWEVPYLEAQAALRRLEAREHPWMEVSEQPPPSSPPPGARDYVVRALGITVPPALDLDALARETAEEWRQRTGSVPQRPVDR